MREDVRLAGFYGETSVAGALYTQPDPCSIAPAGWGGTPLTLPTAVQGYTPADALACLDHRKAGTDALAVRRVGITAIDPATIVAGNTQFYVQYSFCVLDVATPRLIFSNDRAALTLRNRACTGVNVARPYVSRIYYVAECNVCAGAGDGVPTLKRVDLVGTQLTTTALAEGIDALRVEYGFDVDGDGSPGYLPDDARRARADGRVVERRQPQGALRHPLARQGDRQQPRHGAGIRSRRHRRSSPPPPTATRAAPTAAPSA